MDVKKDRFCGVVVIMSALHAEGREFEPRQNMVIILDIKLIMRGYRDLEMTCMCQERFALVRKIEKSVGN